MLKGRTDSGFRGHLRQVILKCLFDLLLLSCSTSINDDW